MGKFEYPRHLVSWLNISFQNPSIHAKTMLLLKINEIVRNYRSIFNQIKFYNFCFHQNHQ